LHVVQLLQESRCCNVQHRQQALEVRHTAINMGRLLCPPPATGPLGTAHCCQYGTPTVSTTGNTPSRHGTLLSIWDAYCVHHRQQALEVRHTAINMGRLLCPPKTVGMSGTQGPMRGSL
jgi:hypothetical protein